MPLKAKIPPLELPRNLPDAISRSGGAGACVWLNAKGAGSVAAAANVAVPARSLRRGWFELGTDVVLRFLCRQHAGRGTGRGGVDDHWGRGPVPAEWLVSKPGRPAQGGAL